MTLKTLNSFLTPKIFYQTTSNLQILSVPDPKKLLEFLDVWSKTKVLVGSNDLEKHLSVFLATKQAILGFNGSDQM